MKTSEQTEFTGRHMLLVISAFFAVIIPVNVGMAISASRTWTGLVVENSYVASQQFQTKADAAHLQNQAGWSMSVGYAQNRLRVDIAAGDEAIQDVVAFVRRPVGGHDDVTIPLTPVGKGFEAEVPLEAGVWDVTITTAETSLGPIERETRISAP